MRAVLRQLLTLGELAESVLEGGVVHNLLDSIEPVVDRFGLLQRRAEPDTEEALACFVDVGEVSESSGRSRDGQTANTHRKP